MNRKTSGWPALLICLFLLLPAVAEAGGSGQSGQYVPHEVLVKFEADVDGARKKAIRSAMDAELVSTVESIGLEHWRLSEQTAVEDAVDRLNGMLEVEYAEPNYLYEPQQVPDDAEFNRLWHLQNTGQVVNGNAGTPGADIDAPAAWDMETGSSDIVVAVIDSGVALEHPDIAENIWKNPGETAGNGADDDENGYVDDVNGWDFVNDDNNPSDYSRDLYGDGHGTHVAGIIAAAGNNGRGSTGVMWQARIMVLQVFDLFEASPLHSGVIQSQNIIEAVAYAIENGAQIINCSFGGDTFSQFQRDIFDKARGQGVLIVAAAGNNAADNDANPTYPAGYELTNIISVAATNEDDQLAKYSNFGKTSVDVAAPGGSREVSNIYSTSPPPRSELFFDDFESGADQWEKPDGQQGWFVVEDDVFDSNVLTDSGNETYAAGLSASVETAEPIDARGVRGVHLQFDIEYQLEEDFDFLFVEISEDGSKYEPIYAVTGFSPGIQRVNLWGNDEPPGTIYLRFLLDTDESENYEGVFIDNISLTGIEWDFSGDPYGFKSGTSMATPVVAGVAGLVWSRKPDLSAAQVKEIVLDTADPLESLAGKVRNGGRVNAAAAVSHDGDGGCFVAAAGQSI
ncbi:MAG: S8 family serine peptidase [Thermodesulfobacteriota bacterium]